MLAEWFVPPAQSIHLHHVQHVHALRYFRQMAYEYQLLYYGVQPPITHQKFHRHSNPETIFFELEQNNRSFQRQSEPLAVNDHTASAVILAHHQPHEVRHQFPVYDSDHQTVTHARLLQLRLNADYLFGVDAPFEWFFQIPQDLHHLKFVGLQPALWLKHHQIIVLRWHHLHNHLL